MKFENIRVYNFEGAIRGMRNPKNSWDLSDSSFGIAEEHFLNEAILNIAWNWLEYLYPNGAGEQEDKIIEEIADWLWQGVRGDTYCDEIYEYNLIGPKDMRLAQNLIRSGPEHRKFLRQIFVSVDITAPLYWQIFCQ